MDVLDRLAAELHKFAGVRGAMPAGKNETLLRDAHNEIERLRDTRPEVVAPQWIACTERMPPDGEKVLAYFPNMPRSWRGPVGIGEVLHRVDGRVFTNNGTSGHESSFPSMVFTHWMPLPSVPSPLRLKEGE